MTLLATEAHEEPATREPAAPGYPEAAALERRLGDPHRPGNPYGFAAAVGRDWADDFPHALADAGLNAGLHLSYLPRTDGGTLDCFDRTLALARIAARRDAAVMPATMFSVTAATCVLAGGSAQQLDRVLATLRAGRSVGFALSEPEAGSDLLANRCELLGEPGQRRLHGTKWLVGAGDRAGLLLVVARTGRRGPGAFTAVLLDLDAAPPGTVRRSGSRATGLTGTELTTFEFRDLPVPEDAVVGPVGHGLATAMHGLQVVRMLSTAANLSCGDVAARTVLRLLTGVRRGGTPVLEFPFVRRELGRIGAALLAMDAAAITTARAAHAAPEALSLWSAVAKRAVTELSRELLDRCLDLAASRGVLADGAGGLLAKVRRDNEVVRSIDTTPVATLRLLALQLAGVSAADSSAGSSSGSGPDLTAFDLAEPLPAFEVGRLDLVVRGPDPVAAALAAVRDDLLGALAGSGPHGPRAAELVGQLERELAATRQTLRDSRSERSAAAELAALDAADRYARLHTAAATALLWHANSDRPLWGTEPGSAGVLRAVLAYLLGPGAGQPERLDDLAPAADLVVDLAGRHLLFSAVPVPLAEANPGRSTWQS